MSEEEIILNSLRSDFPNIDLSFIRGNSDVTYDFYNDVKIFENKFFAYLDSESPNYSTFILEGLDYVKFASRSVTGSPVLAYSIKIDSSNKCTYNFMGVK